MKIPELSRILPSLAPWIDGDRDSATVSAAIGLSVGGSVGGLIAWLGYPLLGGLIGAALLMLLIRMVPTSEPE